MPSIKSPIGMLMFEHLFVARPVVPGGDPRFNCVLLIDKEGQASPEYRALKAACLDAIEAKWPGKSRDPAFTKTLRNPFRSAAEKDQYTGFTPDKIFINPWSKNKPGIVDGRLQDITAPSEVWAGQLAKVSVAPFAYDQGGNKGVGLMLNNVQIVNANMPRMDGRKTAAQEFDAVDVPVDPDDGEAPF